MNILARTISLSLVATVAAHAAPPLITTDRVALIGDSITEQKIYTVLTESYLLACQPAGERPGEVAQFGWGGERITALYPRLATSVEWFHPTVATLLYGMNDGSYAPPDPVGEKTYRDYLTRTVKTLKADGARRVLVGSPGAVDGASFTRINITAEAYNHTLARLGDIAREVAQANGVEYVDLHDPMMAVMAQGKAKYGPHYSLAGADGVHPQANGHLVMAYAFLKALGCQGEIGTFHWNAATGAASASAGHAVKHSDRRDLTIESSRYPFCLVDDPARPDGSRTVAQFIPFNQDLNRMMLIVDGLNGRGAKLTWGSATRVYSAAQLEHGINLAADFPDNPFSKPFSELEAAVSRQQALETPMTKGVLLYSPMLKDAAPAAYPIFRDALEKAREERLDAARAVLHPVRHTLTLERE